MKYLLDTHILLWALQDHKKLNQNIKLLIMDDNNDILFSTASIWEVAIKYGRKSIDDFIQPSLFHQSLLTAGYQSLTITDNHALMVATLPPIHQDPFDRIMIAQAKAENLTFITADEKIKQYDKVSVLMV